MLKINIKLKLNSIYPFIFTEFKSSDYQAPVTACFKQNCDKKGGGSSKKYSCKKKKKKKKKREKICDKIEMEALR